VKVIKYRSETSSSIETLVVTITPFALTLYVTCVTHFFTRRAAASVEATKTRARTFYIQYKSPFQELNQTEYIGLLKIR
jgi:hypothetical protein